MGASTNFSRERSRYKRKVGTRDENGQKVRTYGRYIYLVFFHGHLKRETLLTNDTFIELLGRVGGNVTLQVTPVSELFSAKGARKQGRVLGMVDFNVFQNTGLTPIDFLTVGENTWKTWSFPRAVHVVQVIP